MQGKWKFYIIEDDKNPLWRRLLKTKRSKKDANRIKISIIIIIQGEDQTISETAKENTGIRWKLH